MALGARDALGDRPGAGVIVGPRGFADAELNKLPFRLIEAGHPLPDAGSLQAGAAIVALIERAPADASFLCLISGGASALVEHLPDGVDLEALVDLNRWLLGSGLDIAAMNRIRQAVSTLKGGRLAVALAGRTCLALLISDVPGDDPALIGSGLLCAARGPLPRIPDGLRRRLRLAPPPAPDDPAFRSIRHEVIASPEVALEAARAAAEAAGYPAVVATERLRGDAAEAGSRIAQALTGGAPGVRLWAGETTVELPSEPGRGGRCQHLALAAAIELAGMNDCVLLAAGTDGRDGPGAPAGAIVDGGTLARGRGRDARACLRRAHSGAFLEAAGDLLHTGPTGTNVADLVIGIRD